LAKRSSCLPSLRPSNSRRSVGGICRQKAGERIGSLSAAWAEFACEEQVEAIAGVICAGEQGGSPRRKPQQPSAWSKHACARD
jgi:hypothetical protein